MSSEAFIEWLVFGYLMLLGIRYLLGARVYLMCALRAAEIRPAKAEEIDPQELQLISLFAGDLMTAGFRHVGFGLISQVITEFAAGPAVVTQNTAYRRAFLPPM